MSGKIQKGIFVFSKGGFSMTVMGMSICLVIGLVLLMIGVVTKKKWIKVVAIIPLLIAIINIILTIGMGMH